MALRGGWKPYDAIIIGTVLVGLVAGPRLAREAWARWLGDSRQVSAPVPVPPPPAPQISSNERSTSSSSLLNR